MWRSRPRQKTRIQTRRVSINRGRGSTRAHGSPRRSATDIIGRQHYPEPNYSPTVVSPSPRPQLRRFPIGEYIDFNEVLYDRRVHELCPAALRLSVDEAVGEVPSLSISIEKTPKQVATNLSTWMEAWNRALPLMTAA